MALPFSEWSREEKDEFAKRRMNEMKFKNEQIKQRHAEVEQDRMKAEAKNSAVKVTKKENISFEKEEDAAPKAESRKEREWDKEKLDQDAEDWNPIKFPGYPSRARRRNLKNRIPQ
ncbi:hypothetical protein CDAR_461551 [Caerostris darwini]|uniref:Uncharacterized protein n=1 Tax=Caerostris darwini TaxID=1538125 RepID=A0AAV4M8G5_9ARAC|nr:hypothetical protein CDAR_461551 [Caerostris darwini]